MPDPDRPPPTFDDLANRPEPGLLSEFLGFLRHNGKWWLVPVLLVLTLIGALIALASTGAAPFIYTLF